MASTFYIVIIMVAVFGAASYFLQEHVLSANSAHILVGSYVVFHHILHSTISFDNIRQATAKFPMIKDLRANESY